MRFLAITGRLAFACFIAALVIGLVASFGTRFHLWNYQTGLLAIFPFCVYFGLAALALGISWGATALVINAGTAASYGATGLVGAVLVLALPMYNIYEVDIAHAIPAIHDISTDTQHPPQFVTLLAERRGAPNGPGYDGAQKVVGPDGKLQSTTLLQKKYYSDIKPIGVLIKPAQLYARALAAVHATGWHIVAEVPAKDGGRIEATQTSFFFGFVSDIVVRVEPAGMGARLDIRSKSREGNSDLGANAANIRDFVKEL